MLGSRSSEMSDIYSVTFAGASWHKPQEACSGRLSWSEINPLDTEAVALRIFAAHLPLHRAMKFLGLSPFRLKSQSSLQFIATLWDKIYFLLSLLLLRSGVWYGTCQETIHSFNTNEKMMLKVIALVCDCLVSLGITATAVSDRMTGMEQYRQFLLEIASVDVALHLPREVPKEYCKLRRGICVSMVAICLVNTASHFYYFSVDGTVSAAIHYFSALVQCTTLALILTRFTCLLLTASSRVSQINKQLVRLKNGISSKATRRLHLSSRNQTLPQRNSDDNEIANGADVIQQNKERKGSVTDFPVDLTILTYGISNNSRQKSLKPVAESTASNTRRWGLGLNMFSQKVLSSQDRHMSEKSLARLDSQPKYADDLDIFSVLPIYSAANQTETFTPETGGFLNVPSATRNDGQTVKLVKFDLQRGKMASKIFPGIHRKASSTPGLDKSLDPEITRPRLIIVEPSRSSRQTGGGGDDVSNCSPSSGQTAMCDGCMADSIRTLRVCYNRLCEVAHRNVSTHAIFLICVLLFFLMNLSSVTFILSTNHHNKQRPAAYLWTVVVLDCAYMLGLTLPAHLSLAEVAHVSQLAGQLQLRLPTAGRAAVETQLLLRTLADHPPSLSVLGVVWLDLRLLTGFLSTFTTYAVLLFTFN